MSVEPENSLEQDGARQTAVGDAARARGGGWRECRAQSRRVGGRWAGWAHDAQAPERRACLVLAVKRTATR